MVVFGLAACGGKTSSSTKELPRAEFAQKADAICTQENKKRAAGPAAPQFNPATATAAQLKSGAAFLKSDAAITRDEVERVSALGEPKEASPKAAWRKLRTTFDALLPVTSDSADAAAKGDVKAFRADFAKLSASDQATTALQKTVGFKVCGQG